MFISICVLFYFLAVYLTISLKWNKINTIVKILTVQYNRNNIDWFVFVLLYIILCTQI